MDHVNLPEEQTEQTEDRDRAENEKPLRLLVVDDEEIMREFLREVLKDEGYQIDLAASGKEALRRMNTSEYDIILTDIVMPELDGLGVVAATKELSYNPSVIVMTGYASMETAVESMKLGAADYITKPFNIDQIRIIVANAAEERTLKARAAEGEFYKELSRKDGLTELYNHRFFHQLLDTEVSRADRYNRVVSLLMIDIDDFKSFNDSHGHPAGDLALRRLALLLKQSSRTCDFVARYGGEEFAIIVPEVSADSARRMAERLLKLVDEAEFEGEEVMVGGRLTISIGVATYPMQAGSKSELVEHADQALYRAKGLGKNRVVVFGEERVN
ncbi:MAG: diguanylate cyclase [Candidatus Eisenbacteria bacterium]|nr:diguanylate cyclase [Candidatus Eisenbacteria bacterium]